MFWIARTLLNRQAKAVDRFIRAGLLTLREKKCDFRKSWTNLVICTLLLGRKEIEPDPVSQTSRKSERTQITVATANDLH